MCDENGNRTFSFLFCFGLCSQTMLKNFLIQLRKQKQLLFSSFLYIVCFFRKQYAIPDKSVETVL